MCLNLQISENLCSQNIVRHESGRNIGHQMVVSLKIKTNKYKLGHENTFRVHMVEHETPMVAHRTPRKSFTGVAHGIIERTPKKHLVSYV